MDAESSRPLGAEVCSVVRKSGPGKPNSPTDPVIEPSPEGALNGIGPAVAGTTARSRTNNATSGSRTACVFIRVHLFSARLPRKSSQIEIPDPLGRN